jgi:hypothetical protein
MSTIVDRTCCFFFFFVISIIVKRRLLRCAVSQLKGNVPRTNNFDEKDTLTDITTQEDNIDTSFIERSSHVKECQQCRTAL